MQVQRIQSNNYSTSFGLKNNKNAAKEVLKRVSPKSKRNIYKTIENFCNLTQKRGVKGQFKLEDIVRSKNSWGEPGPSHLIFSIKPAQTTEQTMYSLPLRYVSTDSFLASLNPELFKSGKKLGNIGRINRLRESGIIKTVRKEGNVYYASLI